MKILMIIAPENFRDEELLIPKRVFEEAGAEVEIASTKKGVAKGMLGARIEVKKDIHEINVDDYDAVVFVGGSGTPLVRQEERALEIAREAAEKGKVLAAICWAPTILAKAGVLKGKHATVWRGPDPEYEKSTDVVLEDHGAIYTGEGVSRDGNIITANGPANAEAFAKEILKVLGK